MNANGPGNPTNAVSDGVSALGLDPLSVQVCSALVATGRIAEADLVRAATLAVRSGQPMRVLLDRLGLLSLTDWAAEAAKTTALALYGPEDMPRKPALDSRLSWEFLLRHALLPMTLDETSAVFATPDPLNEKAISALRLLFGEKLKLVVASDRDIEAVFERGEIGDEDEPVDPDEFPADGYDSDLERLLELANNAPTIRFVEEMFSDALARRATDIHLEPLSDKPRVRLRVDGILVSAEAPSAVLYRGVISRLKILSGLDVAERRRPQDGRISLKADNRRIDIRIAIAPTIHGEAATLRFLDARAGLAELSALELPPDVASVFDQALAQPNGIVLVSGPTGSGKTTTLHAALAELNEIGRKIVTIENPVEIMTPGLVQIEIDPALDWTFASALRAILRHDPNVLMVGEIRDEETAEMAIRLALTGHLVFSTVHTNSASEAPRRLANLGVAEHLMSATLRMVASQRLVRELCPVCSVPATETDRARYFEAVEEAQTLAPHWVAPETERLMAPVGCDACDGQGFRGRLGVFEAMDGPTSVEACRDGFVARHRKMGEHGLEQVAAGRTTLDELFRTVGPPGAWR
ncbi:MAG: GspE/PulE family protein [Pseudomonadota bacterium]